MPEQGFKSGLQGNMAPLPAPAGRRGLAVATGKLYCGNTASGAIVALPSMPRSITCSPSRAKRRHGRARRADTNKPDSSFAAARADPGPLIGEAAIPIGSASQPQLRSGSPASRPQTGCPISPVETHELLEYRSGRDSAAAGQSRRGARAVVGRGIPSEQCFPGAEATDQNIS